MNSRTIGLVVLVCVGVVGAQVAAGLLYLGGAFVQEAVFQQQAQVDIGGPRGFVNTRLPKEGQ